VGAFVVTWNRPEPLRRSLETLLRQTWPPDAIFVIDNGDGDAALRVTQDVGEGRIPYRRTGDNLGPAGGIAFGMRWLVELGFEWILVNDDDNCLWRDDILARLRTLIRRHRDDANVGAVARSGFRWDRRSGRMVVVSDRELHGEVAVEVTCGDLHPIFRREVIETIGPFHEDLFFGRDDEMYCLKMLRCGWSIVVDGDLWAEANVVKAQRGFTTQGPMRRHLNRPDAWTAYYSTRNYIAEMRRTLGRPDLARREVVRAAARAAVAWLGGPRRGAQATRLQARAVLDGYRNRLGRTIDPVPKARDQQASERSTPSE
jgi:GT2 family glycosyltransferase